MLANGTVHSDSYRWWRTIRRPTRLIRADRARAIDRIIDYFGEGSGAASAGPAHGSRASGSASGE